MRNILSWFLSLFPNYRLGVYTVLLNYIKSVTTSDCSCNPICPYLRARNLNVKHFPEIWKRRHLTLFNGNLKAVWFNDNYERITFLEEAIKLIEKNQIHGSKSRSI